MFVTFLFLIFSFQTYELPTRLPARRMRSTLPPAAGWRRWRAPTRPISATNLSLDHNLIMVERPQSTDIGRAGACISNPCVSLLSPAMGMYSHILSHVSKRDKALIRCTAFRKTNSGTSATVVQVFRNPARAFSGFRLRKKHGWSTETEAAKLMLSVSYFFNTSFIPWVWASKSSQRVLLRSQWRGDGQWVSLSEINGNI